VGGLCQLPAAGHHPRPGAHDAAVPQRETDAGAIRRRRRDLFESDVPGASGRRQITTRFNSLNFLAYCS